MYNFSIFNGNYDHLKKILYQNSLIAYNSKIMMKFINKYIFFDMFVDKYNYLLTNTSINNYNFGNISN